jgi:uncharacterized membrane protein
VVEKSARIACSNFYFFATTIFRMILTQSYVLLAVTIVVALINFLGAYFTLRKARAKAGDPESNKSQTGLIRRLRSPQ